MADTGFEVWRDCARVAIVTRQSRNSKTGDMAQLWILLRDMSIIDARRTGADELTCGGCILRPVLKGGCYVTFQAPLSIWRAWQRGRYPRYTLEESADAMRGEVIRLGAYGDPAFLPLEVLESLTRYARRWTGYTHQWRVCRPEYARYLMASCDSPRDRPEAHLHTYRTFTLADTPGDREILCPASAEAGRRTTCERCGLCNGRPDQFKDTRKDIIIPAHGYQAKAARLAVA